MKNSNDKQRDAAPIRNQPCSEKTCATCFENRGCMYEQYAVTATHNMEKLIPEKKISAAAAISKRA